jgi:hypothetical protein
MAFGATQTTHALFQDKTSGSSQTSNPITTTCAAGRIVYVSIAKDNVATVDGETSEVINVTDSVGNTYQKAKEFCNSQGSANAGATVALWWSNTKTALVDAVDTVTVTYSSAITAKGFVVTSQSIGAGNGAEVEASTTLANDGADPGSMDLTVANISHSWMRVLAHERPTSDTFTKTAAYIGSDQTGTTGGGAASNMTVSREYDVFTGTSNPSDPAWNNAADEASILVAFKEVTLPTSSTMGGWIGKGGWF